MLHIKRFEVRAETWQVVKRNEPVTIPEVLDLAPMCAADGCVAPFRDQWSGLGEEAVYAYTDDGAPRATVTPPGDARGPSLSLAGAKRHRETADDEEKQLERAIEQSLREQQGDGAALGSSHVPRSSRDSEYETNLKQALLESMMDAGPATGKNANSLSPALQETSTVHVPDDVTLARVQKLLSDAGANVQARRLSAARPPSYRLLCVVYHHGEQAGFGHYTTAVRQHDDSWTWYNDSRARKGIGLKQIAHEQDARRSAFICVYERT